MFDPVLEHYEWFLHACKLICILDPPILFWTNHGLINTEEHRPGIRTTPEYNGTETKG